MMEYKGYTVRVEFDDDIGMFHGEVINTRDVITFQGDSVTNLKKAFRDSVDDYLQFCADRGEEPDKPFSGRFLWRPGVDLHRRAVETAAASGRSLNTWISELVEKAMSKSTADNQ